LLIKGQAKLFQLIMKKEMFMIFANKYRSRKKRFNIRFTLISALINLEVDF
jgi:predicted nucleic acid-binding Zn ribbon protein